MEKDKKPVFIVDGQEVGADGKPIQPAETEASPQSAETEKLRQELALAQRERDELQLKVKNQAEIIERGTADSKRLIREAGASNENSFRLKAELDKANEQLEKERAGGQSIITDHQNRIKELQVERDSLQQQVQKLGTEVSESHADLDVVDGKLAEALARPLLPANARDKLIAVNGINAALADKALEALKPEPEQPAGK